MLTTEGSRTGFRCPVPRQQSFPSPSTNGMEGSHPPRRVQSERIGRTYS